MNSRGVVKVTDFGLAKGNAVGPGLTQTGIVVGTPDYIAPEQARGEPLDARADIYGLGCTLFHLVAGAPPYRSALESETRYMEIVMRHLGDPIPDLGAATRGACDPALAELCARMMAKTPNGRPGYDELCAVLESVSQRLGSAALPAAGAAVAASEGMPTANERIPSELRPRPRTGALPGWVWAITVLSVVVFLTGLVLRLLPRAG
jgi:serine/threonine-protein kinase